MNSSMISCHLHDYIEIACLYGYRVELTLTSGERIKGRPKTTRSSQQKEYLVIDTGQDQQQIELNQIKTMQAVSTNPHFERIDFC